MRGERRVDLVWQGQEVEAYNRLSSRAHEQQQSIQSYIKDALEEDNGE